MTLLFSRDGHRLYCGGDDRARVAEIDVASGKVLRRISVGRDGDGLAIAP
ncbi:YncE family protein [Sphingomonas sp. MMS24-JH45]